MKKLCYILNLIRSEGGIAVVIAVFVVAILFILITAFIPMMINDMSVTNVQRKSNQAFYIAEAGLDQAVWTIQQGNNWQIYSNSGSSITENGTLSNGRYSLIYEASTSSANQMNVTSEGFASINGSDEVKRTIEAILVNTRFAAFNHPLQSQTTLENPGEPTVKYGDVYAYDYIDFQGNVPPTPNYYSVTGFKRNNSVISDISPYANLHIISSDNFPNLTESDLDFLKDYARKTNTYYSNSDSNHNFTRDELEQINASNPEGTIVFVDTPNGHAYSEANKANVTVQTNSYFNGVFIVKGDLYIAGNGSGTVVAQDENGNPVTLSAITFNGHVYAAGSYAWAGTPGIYGSLVAGQVAGTGTPNIWYNISFRNSPLLPTVLGAIEIVSWHEKK